jgi:hypothetical protein
MLLSDSLTSHHPGAHARECLTNETIPEGYSHWTPSLDLTDPSQLTQFSDCDTLIGIIEVSRNFTGTIELPAVTNFSGYINLYEGPTYGLEAVVLPNVRYMESIQLHGAWGVKRLYAPKVETLDDLIVSVGVEEGAVFDLSALREVKYVSMAGYWSRYVPSLTSDCSRPHCSESLPGLACLFGLQTAACVYSLT